MPDGNQEPLSQELWIAVLGVGRMPWLKPRQEIQLKMLNVESAPWLLDNSNKNNSQCRLRLSGTGVDVGVHHYNNKQAQVIWDPWPNDRPRGSQRRREVIFRQLGRNVIFHRRRNYRRNTTICQPERDAVMPHTPIGKDTIRTTRSRALGHPVVNSRVDRLQLHRSAALK